jgi:hypothetical protein
MLSVQILRKVLEQKSVQHFRTLSFKKMCHEQNITLKVMNMC